MLLQKMFLPQHFCIDISIRIDAEIYRLRYKHKYRETDEYE